MTTELAKTTTDLITFDAPKIALIKRMVAKDATDDELELFLHQCRRTGLDPMAKQIYFQKRAGKPVIITGIDGYRLVADRTGKYAGNDDPIFDNEESPCMATVTVYKMIGGVRCPFTASARWHQYYPGEKAGAMWDKMPHLMLGKCAEALALRKAFPAELSGMHTDDEMAQSAEVVVVPAGSAASAQGAAKAAFDAGNPKRQESAEGYEPQNRSHQDWLMKQLKAKSVAEDRWDDIGNALRGRPASDLGAVMTSILGP